MPPPIARPIGKLDFVDLPLETQQQIVGHMSRKDLFVFQRLSPHCFFLANAQIYRNLDLNLTNSGEEERGTANSHAADALQTILASEHNYGQHIKSFRLGVLDDSIDVTGHSSRQDPLLMTRLLWDSKSDSSKFLNTTLLLVMRKANILETFQWDAPIEMSGAVYQALHKIASLRHLRVRLDVSPSPKMVIRQGLPPSHHPPPLIQNAQGNPPQPGYVPPLPNTGPVALSSHPGQAASKSNVKRKKAGGIGGCNYWANPRSFSGFKYLSTLALMGLSNLDCLPEVAECIKASSATLKCLTVTLSMDLARKARKPAAVNPDLEDPSDTELDEDELLNDPLAPPTAATQPPPANEADIRREKVAQDSILAKIFDLQSVAAEGRKIEKNLSLPAAQLLLGQDSEAINKKVNSLMKSLINAPIVSDADPTSTAYRVDHFKMIREVADLYITSQNVQKKMLKEQKKPSSPSKKPGTPSKPLNPLANDFKQSPQSNQPPGFYSGLGFPDEASLTGSLLDGTINPYSFSGNGIGDCSTSSAPGYPSSSNGLTSINTYPPIFDASKSSDPQLHSYMQQKNMEKEIDQLKHQNEEAEAHLQAYMSPYGTAPFAKALEASASLPPYTSGQNNNPTLYSPADLVKAEMDFPMHFPSFLPPPPLSSNGAITTSNFAFGTPNDPSSSIQTGLSNGPKKAKIKPQKTQKAVPAPVTTSAGSDDDTDIATKTPLSVTQPFFPAEITPEDPVDPMDVDMEHPDEDTQELGEDQETVSQGEDVDVPTPRKRAKFGNLENAVASKASQESSAKSASMAALEAITTDEAMQAYIRTTHGLQLESLCLEWIPLKASVVARALDLSVLKRLTLLEVGSQDAFWTLLVRLQKASPEIAFKSIHTDNVSLAFMKFLTTFEGMEELFLHERGTKQGEDSTSGTPISITVIRKLGLHKHAATLKRLMIRNERSESWDLDARTLQFLAVKGTGLRELAVSLNMKTYHVLMQYFAAFKNLYALHLIALRSGDRSMILQSESLNFAVDSLSHCPDMKIKYIAIVQSVVALESKPEHLKKHLTMVLERRRDKKGKGKAPADFHSLLEQFDDSGSDEVEEALAEVMAGESKLRIPTGFGAAEDVKIFSKQIRTGKL